MGRLLPSNVAANLTAGAFLWLSSCGGPVEGNSSDDQDDPSGGDSAAGGTGPSGGTAGANGGTVATGGSNGGGLPQGGTVGGGGTAGVSSGGSAGVMGGTAGGGKGGIGGSAGKGGSAGTGGSSGSSSGGKATYTLEYVGNITTNNAVDTDGEVFSRHWNQISPENAGKWGSVQTSPTAAFDWRTVDAIYNYAQTNNLVFKEHTFIWGNQQPTGSITETHVRNWMREFCRRYPNTRIIDVVNEPPPHTTPSYVNAIGGGTNGNWQWITNAFAWANEACPNAVLIMNDFNNIEWSGDQDHFIDIVQTIKAAGAPIEGIGAQAHDLDHQSVTFSTVQTLLARLATQTQLPIYVTEMDISTTDDNRQLQLYQQYFPLFRDSGYVRGVTIWGWIYGKTWSQAPQSGLIRNGTARPAMTWLMQELGRPVP
jgi:endo-1,4-beta-xylanase